MCYLQVVKYLVLGATGLLGSKLFELLEECHGTYYKTLTGPNLRLHYLEFSNLVSLQNLVDEIEPAVIINCIGFSNVDQCEFFPEKNWRLNSWLPFELAKFCAVQSIKFVHISTDHFLNLSQPKLKEENPVEVVNQYGLAKLSAEKSILSLSSNAIIVRTNFFHFDKNFASTFIDKLLNDNLHSKTTSSFNDVFFTPVSTTAFCECIVQLIHWNFSGLINVSSSESISKFHFHGLILKSFGGNLEIHKPVSINFANLDAPRPKNMSLDNSFLKSLGVYKMPSIQDMIDTELKTLERSGLEQNEE
jgi:dTDP-4-dehydrorhamnose reductase